MESLAKTGKALMANLPQEKDSLPFFRRNMVTDYRLLYGAAAIGGGQGRADQRLIMDAAKKGGGWMRGPWVRYVSFASLSRPPSNFRPNAHERWLTVGTEL